MPETMSPEQMAIIKELSGRTDLNPNQQAIVNELMSRMQSAEAPPAGEPAPMSTEQQPEGYRLSQILSGEVKPEAADYLNALWEGTKAGGELALMMGTGAAAIPASGYAGIAKYLTSGGEEAKKTIEEVQKGLTYEPRSEVLKQAFGYTAQAASEIPGMKTAGKTIGAITEIPKGMGDITYDTMIKIGLPPSVASYYAASAKSSIPAAIELLSLPGTGAAKKQLLKKLLDKADKTEFYDEAGKLLPEVRKAVKEAGIETGDILPESIVTEEAAKPLIGKIAKAKGKTGSVAGEIALDVKPDKNVIEAAKEFGVLEDIPTSWISKNPTYQAVEQGLKSIAGSGIEETELRAIEKLAKEADNLITEFGGTTSKSNLSDQFRLDSISKIEELGKQSDDFYKKAYNMIDETMPVKAPKTLETLQKMASKKVVGGDIEIGKKRIKSPLFRRLLNELPKEDITYDYLDSMRREVGDALNKNSGPFKDENKSLLKKVYATLTKDQEASITNPEALNFYKAGKNLVFQRKVLENQLSQIIGKDITGDIAQTAKTAILSMQEGRTKEWDRLARNIPKELGEETRRKVFATALKDVFTQGSKKEKSLHLVGFDNFMNGLKQNTSNYLRLQKELGKDNMDRLKRFHDLISAGRKARTFDVKTGKSLSTPGLLDEIQTVTERIYGVTRPIERIPGGKIGSGIIGTILNIKPSAKSELADRLLSSNKFKNLVIRKLTNQKITPQAEDNLNNLIGKLDEFKKWKKALSGPELADLTAVGALGYFTGKTRQQEQTQ